MTRLWATVRSSFKGQLRGLAAVGMLSGAASVAEVGVISLVALVVSSAAEGKSQLHLERWGQTLDVSLVALIVASGVAVVLRVFLQVLSTAVSSTYYSRYLTDRRRQLFGLYLHAHYESKSGTAGAELQTLLIQNVDRATGVLRHVMNALVSAVSAFVLLASAMLLSPMFVAANVVVAVVLFAVLRPMTLAAKRATKAATEIAVNYAGQVAETVTLAREIQIFRVEPPVEARANATLDDAQRRDWTNNFFDGLQSPVYQNTIAFVALAILAAVALGGAADLRTLGMFVVLMLRVGSYTQNLQGSYHQVVSKSAYLEQLNAAEARHASDRRLPGGTRVERAGVVEVRELHFAYAEGTPVLDGVTFRITAGESIGIVGPSGAGKTTLSRVLLGLCRPTKGDVLIDGVPLQQIDDASWQRLVSYVPQEPELLRGSVRQNVAFFREGLTQEAIEHACKLASIHDTILSLPNGYDTDVGEGGGRLSVGQRQRICLARALALKPKLLILDEPTSALDAVSERAVSEALDSLHGNTTLVIIAHRIKTLERCDRVMVLERGGISAFDTPAALGNASAFFQRSLELS